MASGAPNPSGVDFPRGDGVGPVDAPGQGWYYNVLLTGTLPSGKDASQYQIKQNVVEQGSATTENGKTISLNHKHQETIAPTKDTKYWAVKGNVIYGLDSPGLRNLDPKSNEFVRSATLTMHFESW